MSFLELFLIAIGLSMDAFAAAICAGLTMRSVTIKKSLIIGLYFGIFQAVMPLMGYLLATRFADNITTYDHWLAFILLFFIGGKMVGECFKNDDTTSGTHLGAGLHNEESPIAEEVPLETSLEVSKMLPLAFVTSIDALAVGISFAFLDEDIVPSVVLIGITTLILSMAGVKIGNIFGMKFKKKAELTGGIVLMLIGLKILLEHIWSV